MGWVNQYHTNDNVYEKDGVQQKRNNHGDELMMYYRCVQIQGSRFGGCVEVVCVSFLMFCFLSCCIRLKPAKLPSLCER